MLTLNFACTNCGRKRRDFYMNQIYPRDLINFPLFGIEAHGFWTAKGDAEPRLK